MRFAETNKYAYPKHRRVGSEYSNYNITIKSEAMSKDKEVSKNLKNRAMKKEIEIKQCYRSCPFFGISMDGMQCYHPYWEDKGTYENMIITQDNSRDGKIPEKCPLKKGQLTIVHKLGES